LRRTPLKPGGVVEVKDVLGRALESPLCGLGEDYEPDIVWSFTTDGVRPECRTSNYDPKAATCFPTSSDAERIRPRHINPSECFAIRLDEMKSWAAAYGRSRLILKDGNGVRLKEWPV
jgi:hypothetical protein